MKCPGDFQEITSYEDSYVTLTRAISQIPPKLPNTPIRSKNAPTPASDRNAELLAPSRALPHNLSASDLKQTPTANFIINYEKATTNNKYLNGNVAIIS